MKVGSWNGLICEHEKCMGDKDTWRKINTNGMECKLFLISLFISQIKKMSLAIPCQSIPYTNICMYIYIYIYIFLAEINKICEIKWRILK